jgi:3-methyladenine DNA glycosylase AlkD
MQSYLSEVIQRLNSLGGTVPVLRKAYQQKYSFSSLPFREQLIIWEFIWKNAPTWQVKTQAFFFCEAHAVKEQNAAHAWKALRHWQNDVADWSFCDSLSKIYTKHLELFPEEVYAQLVKWNRDRDLWKRRQSIVSLLYYTRTKKKILPYEKIQPLIHSLLDDHEYYVQKSVGWSLRELYNAYPEKTFNYMQRNVARISSIAFSAATEKLDAKSKKILKDLRK